MHTSNAAPETFGRYRLLGLLGEGGMGRLYVAERRGIQGFVKIVALKRILPHLADSSQLREMFLNEARIAARLEHPNIVATYELGEVEGKYFISMEYLPGEDLSATIGRAEGAGGIPVEVAAALAQQASQGLHYAHEAKDGQGRPIGIVHRDVNPHNIFVTYHGVVKLLDFGVVRGPLGGQKSVPGVFKGKYGYCAPEQIEGGPVDRRTDVFCLGIVLWECLTGARLFEGQGDARTIDAVRSRLVEPPSKLRPDVPKALDEIAMRALSRDPAGRYQSAHDLSEDLDRFLLQCQSRPTSKSIGRWLESIFGSDRAALKKTISQGGGAEEALERLAVLDGPRTRTGETSGERSGERSGSGSGSSGGRSKVQPRALWSTSLGTGESSSPPADKITGFRSSPSMPAPVAPMPYPSSSPALRAAGGVPEPIGAGGRSSGRIAAPQTGSRARVDPRRSRRTGPFVVGTLLAVLAGLVAGWMVRQGSGGSSEPAAPAPTTATIQLSSQPPGAYVFVDGSPSGLRTPAVLNGLPVGRALEIRLDKPGFEAVSQQTKLEAGETRVLSLVLKEAVGSIRILGAPRQAVGFLDDQVVDMKRTFAAPAGSHRLRVELDQSVLLSRTIEVTAGEQITIDLSKERNDQ